MIPRDFVIGTQTLSGAHMPGGGNVDDDDVEAKNIVLWTDGQGRRFLPISADKSQP